MNRDLNEGKENVMWTSEGLQVGDQQGGRPSWRKVVGKFKKQQKDHVAGENLGRGTDIWPARHRGARVAM